MKKIFLKTLYLLGLFFFFLMYTQCIVTAGPLGFDFAPSEFGQNTLDRFMLKTYFDTSKYNKKDLSKNNKGQIVIGKEIAAPKDISPFGSTSLVITIDPKTNKIIGLKYKAYLPDGVAKTRLDDWHKYYGQEVISRYGNPIFKGNDEYGYLVSSFHEEGKYKYTISAYMANDKFEKIPQNLFEKKTPMGDKTYTALKGIAVFSVDIEAI